MKRTLRNLPAAALAALCALVAAPAHAAGLRLGTLDFKPCELAQKDSGATTAALCTPFAVPENRAAPDGRRIDLKLALIKSDAAVADPDIVVYLAGGPGQAATTTWPALAAALAPLRKHHHILLLDQRGTGASHALACKGNPQDADAAGIDLDKVRANVAKCLADVEKTADPRFYTTADAVADLEAVRQALGTPAFDLVGVSYGTRVAQQYLRAHPDGVRSVVLDGVVPNALILGSEFAVNLDAALKADFALCTGTPACAKRYGDPYKALYALRDELRAAPREVSFRDPVTFANVQRRLDEYSLASVVRMFAYSAETAALLPLSIDAASRGEVAPLLGQAKLLSGDLSDLEESGMQLSVICSEDADLLKPRPQDADLILGTHLIDTIKAACTIWPHGGMPVDFHAPIRSDKPVLLLSGELDPVTPPRYAGEVLEGLRNGRSLVAKGQGHNVIGRGCLPKLVGEFIDKLDPKTLDAGCISDFGPTPAFIDFNGASP